MEKVIDELIGQEVTITVEIEDQMLRFLLENMHLQYDSRKQPHRLVASNRCGDAVFIMLTKEGC